MDADDDGIACNEDDQQNVTCENPQPVVTFGPETENQITDPFEITGDTFRLTYDVEVTDPNGFPVLEVDVLDESSQPIGEGFITFGEDGSENVLAGPGTFSLEIRADDVRYEIDVEDCTGAGSQTPGDDDPAGDDDNVDDDVINVPDKPLPNTGGFPPLLALGFLLVAGAGLGTAIVRRRY